MLGVALTLVLATHCALAESPNRSAPHPIERYTLLRKDDIVKLVEPRQFRLQRSLRMGPNC